MIRRALIDDGDRILSFINSEWKKNHYFCLNSDFFNYFYSFKSSDYLNFYISEDDNKFINGILGFIDYSNAKEKISNIAIAMWKVKKTNDPTLGIKLFEFLRSDLRISNLFCLGIDKKTHIIYEYLGFKVDKLSRYIMINQRKKKFKILNNLQIHKEQPQLKVQNQLKYSDGKDISEEFYQEAAKINEINYKSYEFFKHRYLQHPVYNYNIYKLELSAKEKAILVTRNISYNKSNMIRIVDFIGEEICINKSQFFFHELLQENNAEYVEFVHFGLSTLSLAEAGFQKLNEEKLTMPHYFQPFINENLDIHFFSSKTQKLKLFLGDGDQDRPN